MKHLIGQEHWPHLKRRAILELFGFFVLIGFVIREWDLIESSLEAIRNGDLLYLALALALYWLLLPLTAVSYKLLCEKKIPVFTTALSHLAGSGPGRIIPGGLGHLSMATFHLKKLGVNIHKALVVSIANNVIGVVMNIAVLIIVLFIKPEIRNSIIDSVTTESILLILLMALWVVVLSVWLYHFRKIRSSVIKVEKQFFKTFKFIRKRPKKLFALFLIAFIILIGNVLMLQLSGDTLRISITPTDAVIALSVGVLIGGLFPTPGGLGGVEAGIATTLSLLGYGTQEAISVALLYRTVTYWQPLIPGTLAYLYLRERNLI